MDAIKPGVVYLVGAGPGDPGLMTLRGHGLLRQADVVVYDHLVSDGCLAFAHTNARLIYVGKTAGKHTASQEEINQCLIEQAKTGNSVVRLKGGDPFVFGRGGEECASLAAQGIPFEVVPGVSAVSAVPAYAGIPITHRNMAAHFTAITGHEAKEGGPYRIDWEQLSKLGGTLIVFMGMLQIRHIADELMRHGTSSTTPVAVIRWGTTKSQFALKGTLASIADRAEELSLRPPGLIVIGEVAAFANTLDWFQSDPNAPQDLNQQRGKE